MVVNNLFIGYKIGGDEPISLSHIQFVDDALILGGKNWANGRAIKATLYLFAAMSGLHVNFHKSILVWFHVIDYWLNEAASIIRCKLGCMPLL